MLKYIIIRRPSERQLAAVLFSTALQHRDMVPAGATAIGAGFCEICGQEVQVSGRSEGLKLDATAEDQRRLDMWVRYGVMA